MPIIKDLIESCDKIKKVHELKNDDYAESSNPFSNFDVAEYFMNLFNNPRDKVFANIIGIKIARLAVLLNKRYDNPNAQPNNESIDDSFIDKATYTLIWKADVLARTSSKNHPLDCEHKWEHNNLTASYYCVYCGARRY